LQLPAMESTICFRIGAREVGLMSD